MVLWNCFNPFRQSLNRILAENLVKFYLATDQILISTERSFIGYYSILLDSNMIYRAVSMGQAPILALIVIWGHVRFMKVSE